MRLYLCQKFLFISSINILLSKESRVVEKEDEISGKSSVFSEVINNITRVNDVLENLLRDYEKLKKIYQSEETLENESFSEAEIGASVKRNKQSRSRKKTKKTKTTQKTAGNYATQMFIYESGDVSNEETESNEEKKNKPVTKPNKVKPKKIQRELKTETVKEKVKSKPKIKSVKKEIKAKNELNIEPVNELKSEPKVEYLKEKSIVVANESENETDSYYDSSSSEGDSTGETNALTLDKPHQGEFEKPVTYTIKRYEFENNHSNGEIKRIRDHSIKVSLINGSNPVWKIVKYEDFSNKNIWNDIVQNKPVNLQKVSEKAYYRYRVSLKNNSSNEKESDFRRNNHFARNEKRTVLRTNDVTVGSKETLENNKTLEKELITSKEYFEHNKTIEKELIPSKEYFEHNKTIEKELFKTRVLRKAYGDACLKVVIKKCYKACKRVASVCKSHGCKGSFQTTFKRNAKTGCIHVFKPPAPVSPEPPIPAPPNPGFNESIWSDLKRRADTDNFDSVFYDVTNNGYLAAVCLPDRRSAKIIPNNKLGNEYNILRDRFERACQKTSSKKCIKACKYSIEQTCATKTCKNKLRNALKTACTRECSNSYGVSSSSDKEDSSDSSESESSSSSASSESDSGDKKKPVKKNNKKKKLKNTKTTKKKLAMKKDDEEEDDKKPSEEEKEEQEEEEEGDEEENEKKKVKKEKKNKSKAEKEADADKKKHKRKKKDKKNKKKKETAESSDDGDENDPTL